MNATVKRYAIVSGMFSPHSDDGVQVGAYLPDNYKVLKVTSQGVVIAGRDDRGWTLDSYIKPRLKSGLFAIEEIDLSHPVMKEISMDQAVV